MIRTFFLLIALALLPFAGSQAAFANEDRAGPTGKGMELMMVEQEGCVWCARWNKEIGPVYPKTEEGKRAPLRRFDKQDPLPDGIKVERRFFYTPTFILLVDGQEKGRIEGYPGEDFFWGLLDQLVTSVDKAVSADADR